MNIFVNKQVVSFAQRRKQTSRCNRLQQTATDCNRLQQTHVSTSPLVKRCLRVSFYANGFGRLFLLQSVAVCCSLLQSVDSFCESQDSFCESFCVPQSMCWSLFTYSHLFQGVFPHIHATSQSNRGAAPSSICRSLQSICRSLFNQFVGLFSRIYVYFEVSCHAHTSCSTPQCNSRAAP